MTVPAKDSARAHILVVEDSSVFREMQGLLLGQAGYVVSSHESPQAALNVAAKQHFDLVVIDYELPEMNGQQFMHALRKIQPEVAVVFVSGALTLDLAIQLSSQGVAGIFNKPANPKTLLEKINETLARQGARDTAARVGSGSPLPTARRGGPGSPFLPNPATSEPSADRLAYAPRFVLGNSDRFREFSHRLWKVRDFRAVLLLQGDPGSPFELLARELAEISIFRDGPIMVCDAAKFEPRALIAALAPSLLSHDAGTLIVTGVETFTLEQQKTLENLLTGRDVFLPFARRFRLVLAGSSALSERVDDGAFGETLYYKISSLSLSVPTLREMRGDILTNARRILVAHHEAGHAQSSLAIAADAAQWIETQEWPGNYDELARTILTAALQSHGNELTLAALAGTGPHDESRHDIAPPPLPPVELTDFDQPPNGEARPPFPVTSLLAQPATEPVFVTTTIFESPPPAVKPEKTRTKPAPQPASAQAAAALGRAPAGQLFARAATPARTLTAQSLFRPASSAYNFDRRLTESLVIADAAH